jgi:hypothetical protein
MGYFYSINAGMSTEDNDLIKRIEQFCSSKPMSERAFGISVAGNHKFISRLRAGHGCHSRTLARVEALINGEPLPRPAHSRHDASEAA